MDALIYLDSSLSSFSPSTVLQMTIFGNVVLLFVAHQVMWLADRHSDQELYTAAKHCAKIHLLQLHQTDEFLNLPLRLLIDIIKGKLDICFTISIF